MDQQRREELVTTLRLLFASLSPEEIASAVYLSVDNPFDTVSSLLSMDHERILNSVSVRSYLNHIQEDRIGHFTGSNEFIWDIIQNSRNLECDDDKDHLYYTITEAAKEAGLMKPWIHQKDCICASAGDHDSQWDCRCDGKGEEELCPEESNTTPTSP
jgi:hypothetical protein